MLSHGPARRLTAKGARRSVSQLHGLDAAEGIDGPWGLAAPSRVVDEIVAWGNDDLPFVHRVLHRVLPCHHGVPGSRRLCILLSRALRRCSPSTAGPRVAAWPTATVASRCAAACLGLRDAHDADSGAGVAGAVVCLQDLKEDPDADGCSILDMPCRRHTQPTDIQIA
jgi:hypothetical protein